MSVLTQQFHIAPVDWNLKFPDYTLDHLTNGIPVYCIDSSIHEISYVELIFENGRLGENKKLSTRICSNQLLEGSQKYSQAEIAEFFDFHGCSYQVLSDLDFTVIGLNCLHKHFEKAFAFLLEVVCWPTFPEESLIKGKKSLQSQLLHQLTEPDFVSYREFSAHAYNKDSVYGYNSSKTLINDIRREDLIQYHQDNFTADKLKVFYCGKPYPLSFWQNSLSAFSIKDNKLKPYVSVPYQQIRKHFPIPNCGQASLKMGMKLFKKSDPDYYPMYFMNTLFGDYFGSRLMNQIREKHGLSYDIHSTVDAQIHDGIFYISAELNPEHTDRAIELIKKEIIKLKETNVKAEELNMLKNYLNGHILRLIDGPYQSILLLKILITEFKNIEAFDFLVDSIKNTQASTIKEIANKYLDENNMSIITAGA